MRGGGPDGSVDCDAVIVGSGPAGATAAQVLSEAGWTVIVLEKGRNHLLHLDAPFGPLGHMSNDEVKFRERHFLGPDPITEPRTYRRGEADGERLITGHVNSLPTTVGGGGVHADGKTPRFRGDDFSLLTTHGPVDGADVIDWPISYDELEPYYAEAEKDIGVAGEPTNPFAEWRSTAFPMPPGPDMFGATLSMPAAQRAGLHPYRAPTAANSVPYDGRPACNNCGFCGAYGCPIEAKGDPVAQLRRALRTGRAEIRPDSHVIDITVVGSTATGVVYLDALRVRHEVRARHVILAAGAFETPRLLLLAERANSSGLVGRNLMFHFQTLTVGGFPFPLHGHKGRCVTGAHDDHIVGDDAQRAAGRDAGLPWVRGGLVEHGASGFPVGEAKTYGPGAHHGAAMRESNLRDRMWVFTMQGEDLAQRTNRIDLDPAVVDAWGRPAGRVTYSPHRHELVASAHAAPILEAVLRDAGASWAFSTTSPPVGDLAAHARNPLGIAPSSYHIMGTARMGDDPALSVVGPDCRSWDIDNLLIVDSSVFATSAGYNPTLTIVAIAARACRLLVGDPLPVTRPLDPDRADPGI